MLKQKEKNNLIVSGNPVLLSREEYSKVSGSCSLAFLGFRYLKFRGGTLRGRLVESTLGLTQPVKQPPGASPCFVKHPGEEFPAFAFPFPVFSTGGQELTFKMPECSS